MDDEKKQSMSKHEQIISQGLFDYCEKNQLDSLERLELITSVVVKSIYIASMKAEIEIDDYLKHLRKTYIDSIPRMNEVFFNLITERNNFEEE